MTVDTVGRTNKRVCVVGLGYTGLPTAAVLASRGFQVVGVEINRETVEIINSGTVHISEPDLEMLVQAAVRTGKLEATETPSEADVFMICVPTPCTDDHRPDMTFVEAAAKSIMPYLKPGNLVILESTSPPGTTERIASLLIEGSGLDSSELYVAHAPERVLPGRILREVVENDRILGGINERSTEACAEFYATFVTGELHLTSSRTAETVKLTENAYRDVNIAFANEISMVAEEFELDVWELIELANKHPRVAILKPGPGVGGHCIAVDPWFLVASAPKTTTLIQTARGINDSKPAWIANRVLSRAQRFKDPTIACLGLAYKPNIDDLRESPAVIVARLVKQGAPGTVLVVEPFIRSHPEFDLVSAEEAARRADIIVFLVAHDHFKKLPRKLLEEKIIIDACGVFRV